MHSRYPESTICLRPPWSARRYCEDIRQLLRPFLIKIFMYTDSSVRYGRTWWYVQVAFWTIINIDNNLEYYR